MLRNPLVIGWMFGYIAATTVYVWLDMSGWAATGPVEPPPGLVQCPLHGSLVATADGYLIGRCDGCCQEVAQGLAWLKKHPPRRKT